MAHADWVPTLAGKLAEITGLTGGVRYYADLPGFLGEAPIGLLTTVDGDEAWNSGVGGSYGIHRMQFTIFTPSVLLPEAHSILVPMIALVRNKLAANLTLGGLVQTIEPPEGAPFYSGPGRVEYGRTIDGAPAEFTAIIFRFTVKDHDTFTVSA